MTFRNCFPGSLHFAGETTRVPSQIFTIRRRSVAVKHGRFHIIDNIARDISRFTLRLPDANPGETLVIIYAPSSVNGETLHAEILAPEQTMLNLHNTVTLGDPVLPLPLVTVPVGPHQSALAVNHTVLPFSDVLVPVLPDVTSVTVLHVALPTPFVQVPVRVALLPKPVFPVGDPRPTVGVAVGSDEGSKPFHSTRFELALIGRTRGPREFPLAGGLSPLPLTLVHAPVRPQVLPRSVRNVSGEAPGVEVAVRKNTLNRRSRQRRQRQRGGRHSPRKSLRTAPSRDNHRWCRGQRRAGDITRERFAHSLLTLRWATVWLFRSLQQLLNQCISAAARAMLRRRVTCALLLQ
ncbi:hypothetical protein V8G54_037313 [Vigna mungo]|uniref:Uncharacterized protein n=1 Tax=Vigna mungo TaxID=3915 RepID=A0AAQ3MK24_VIGMU